MRFKKTKDVKFQPWIGKNYKRGGLLLFGESHYEKEKKDRYPIYKYTKSVVENFMSGTKFRYFGNIESILLSSGAYKTMDDVAFANGIQVFLSNAKEQPTSEDKIKVAAAFKNYVDCLQPSKAIILSKRLWVDWLWAGPWEEKKVKTLIRGGKQSEIWRYKYDGGSCLCIGIHHPSRGFSAASWRPLVHAFLKSE